MNKRKLKLPLLFNVLLTLFVLLLSDLFVVGGKVTVEAVVVWQEM